MATLYIYFNALLYFLISGNQCFSIPLQTPPPLFALKIGYSYVIEVADSEYQLLLHHKFLVSAIFAFYHLLKYAQGRPGRRAHVHLGHNCFIQIVFQKYLEFLRLLGS